MIGFAEWNMRPELAGLWQICFQESERYPKYFLNNYFRPRDCLVYQAAGRIAAAVYLLPAKIALGGRTAQAHYIFAAGTLPRFRSRGYMASLLAYAAICGAERGDRYSAVLPASAPLYSFYDRNGYSDFFQVRTVSVPRGRLEELAGPAPLGKILASSAELNALRTRALSRERGSVLWSDAMLRFAFGFGAAYGDRLVCARSEGRSSYALCRMEGKDGCTVRETMISRDGFGALAAAILREAPASAYAFRLPAGCGPFSGEGSLERCGMIRPIGGARPLPPGAAAPYLGLALD